MDFARHRYQRERAGSCCRGCGRRTGCCGLCQGRSGEDKGAHACRDREPGATVKTIQSGGKEFVFHLLRIQPARAPSPGFAGAKPQKKKRFPKFQEAPHSCEQVFLYAVSGIFTRNRSMVIFNARSILRRSPRSSGAWKVDATPDLDARPVRPTRCTKSSAIFGMS